MATSTWTWICKFSESKINIFFIFSNYMKIAAVAVGPLLTNASESGPVICVTNAEGAIHLFILRLNVCNKDRKDK